jgi:histidinol-phosphate/aromatic aminotransferase/cobyric acid decarboxylase-like protein
VWRGATEYPDPAYTKRISEDVRRGLTLNSSTYVSLYKGERIKTGIQKNLIASDVTILETSESELDTFLQDAEASQHDGRKKVIFVNHFGEENPKRLEKLDRLAAIAQANNYLLVIDEPYDPKREKDTSAIQLPEKYTSVIVTQPSGLPGAQLGWTVMSKDIGRYFELIEIPYSPRGIQLEFASLLFPPTYTVELPPDTQEVAYDPPIQSELKQKEKSTGYVHALEEQETDPEILAIDGVAHLDLSRGELMVDYKPELFGKFLTDDDYAAFGRMIWESALSYPDKVSLEEAKKDLRKWLGLSEEPATQSYITISDEGSDKILKKIIEEFTPYHIDVLGQGPQFPQFAEYAGDRYISVQPTSLTVREGVDMLIRELQFAEPTDEDNRRLILVNNPGSPAGDTVSDLDELPLSDAVSIEKLEELADLAEKGNHILVIDEAFIHSLPKSYSAVKLTERFASVIVTQSSSKVLGFPGGIGWAVMSKELGEHYKKIEEPVAGPQTLFAKALFKEGIIDAYLEKLVPDLIKRKAELHRLFHEIGLDILPTNPSTTIMAIIGPPEVREAMRRRLRLTLAEGDAWQATHDLMTKQINRLTVPMNAMYRHVEAILNLAKGNPLL